MGGKKKADRTKGNVRPSSSGRSAELLSSSCAMPSGFTGFSGLAIDTLNYVPATSQVCEEVDIAVDSDFRLVMRKMTKKDDITKLKAVQEFAELCQNKDEETLKGVLPFWPRLYNRLAMEHDRRVRESTHRAHQELVKKVGRNLAPHLRSIMAVWLVSQCEPYGPAATAAKCAFYEAFPETKQSEALMFCKDEIFNYLQDSLFSQAVKTTDASATHTQEEMKNKYHRILKSSLDGLSLFVLAVAPMEYGKFQNNIDEILQEPKFWKFAKHKESMVQLSWYNLIISLCEKMPSCLTPCASKICPLTLGQLGGSDLIVMPVIWECSLHILNAIEDCWKHVNARKAVLPQLFSVLKNGGHGNAVVLFPKLLPLLSKIPDDIAGDKLTFYQQLFQNMKCGLTLQKVQCSHSECNAIIQAFMECIQYALSKSCHDEQGEVLQQHIVFNQLLPVLESSITEEKCHLSRSCLYGKLKELLDYFRDQASVDSPNGKVSERMLGLFWDKFFIMCKSVMDGDVSEQERGLSRLSEFFCCLHQTEITKYKQKKKVAFNDASKNSLKNVATRIPSVKSSTSFAADYHIVGPTQELCCKAMKKFEETKSLSYLKLLCEVMGTVVSKELFAVLLESSMDLSICPDDAPAEYFHQVLCPWILDINSVSENKRNYATCFVNMVVSICSTVSQQMAEKILVEFTKPKSSILLECLIETAANAPQDSILRLWIHGPHVGKMVVAHAEELCEATLGKSSTNTEYITSIWNMLHLCLTSSEWSEPIIGTEYLSEILEIFHHCLMSNITSAAAGKKQVIEFVCDLSNSLFSSYKGCWELKPTEDLLLSLFLLSCDTVDLETVSEKLMQSWQLGVKHLLAEKCDLLCPDGFFFQAAVKIHEQLLYQLNSTRSEEKLTATILKLLSIMNEVLEDDTDESFHSKICSQLEIIFPSEKQWKQMQNNLNAQYLTSAILDEKLIAADSQATSLLETPPSHCLVSLFVSEVFIALLDTSQNSPKKADKHFLKGEKTLDVLLKQMPNVILALAYCIYAGHGYKTTKMCSEGKEKVLLYEKLMHNTALLLSALDETSYVSLINNLSNMSLQIGMIWPLAMSLAISFETRSSSIVREHLTQLLNKINYEDTHHLQTLKAILPYLSLHSITKIVVRTTNILVCTEDIFSAQGAACLIHILASCVEVEGALSVQDIKDHINITLEYLLGIKNLNGNNLLENCALSLKQDGHLYLVSNSMSLLEKVLLQHPSLFEQKHWDFLLCSLVGWIQSCDMSKSLYQTSLPVLGFCVRTFGLLSAVVYFIDNAEKLAETERLPSSLLEEWNDLFAENIYKICLPLFMTIAENSIDNNCLSIGQEELLKNMAKSLKYIPLNQVIECEVPHQHEKLPSSIFYLLDHLVPLLTCGIRSVQLTSHFLLMKIMPQLAKEMSEKEKTEEDQRYPPDSFIKHLQQTGTVVETMLSDFRIGDCCVLKPYSDAYTYGRAYLLAWIQLLEFFYCASSEERSEYASYLRDKGLIDTMLNSLFCLMPHDPSLSCEQNMKSAQHSKKRSPETMFTQQPSLAIDDVDTSFELQHLSCQVYLSALQKLPALVRQWWTNQEKRAAEIVNKFTSNYVSSSICAREIQSVHEDDKKFTNMVVKARPSAREVVATYTIDEVTIELMIQLPSNHPLGPVVVESGRRVGVAQTQWRNWMLQLTTFLTHQNGSILEGLALWKRNVDKRFEGVEECMICFYVVHGSTCQLPRLTCRTCKKKFHSACLYKWFSTSNNSSCPLCRNLF